MRLIVSESGQRNSYDVETDGRRLARRKGGEYDAKNYDSWNVGKLSYDPEHRSIGLCG
jgi:hypothetical protein